MVRENTSNLDLVKPGRLDQYNIDDFNNNFQKIDDFAGLVPPKALTADKLTVIRKINEVDFDGTQDITLPTVNLSGDQTIGGVKTFSEVIQGTITYAQKAINDENGDNIAETYVKNVDFKDKINQSKALETGMVSYDEDVFNYIKKYRHSNFDIFKVQIVGNPTISPDGIASNFSGTNYLTFNVGESDTYYFEFVLNDYTVNLNPILQKNSFNRIIISQTGYITVFADENNANPYNVTFDHLPQIINNTLYGLKVSLDGTNATATLTNLSTNATNSKSVAFTHKITSLIDTCLIGSDANRFFNGSINLRQSYIKNNGQDVFNTLVTDIDTVKPDNYEIVGNPTVTSDGVVTNSDKNNYPAMPVSAFEQIGNNPWRLEWETTLLPPVANSLDIGRYWDQVNQAIYVGRFNTSEAVFLRLALNNNGTPTLTNPLFVVVSPKYYGQKYKAVLSFDGEETYKLDLNFSDETYSISHNSSDKLAIPTQAVALNSIASSETRDFDLNTVKLYIGEKLVCQPCLKIPYTESKTGSKIVDSVYRDRVIDLYEQQGQAGYYTIDEANKNFTLPMGEIYGMIERIKNVSENEIALPVPTLSNALKDNEIWLEGAEVNKITYFKLYEIYGDNYGTPTGSNNFILPDFRGRVLQGMETGGNWGYISAGLPNITGKIDSSTTSSNAEVFGETPKSSTLEEGALSGIWGSQNAVPDASVSANNILKGFSFNASSSNSIYGNSATVQPPAIKVRFKTRYE